MNQLLRVADVAELTQLSPSTIYQWAETGRIPSFRLGNRVRFDSGEIRQWLEKKKRRAVS
jgi:excisionase family DNA binding protein